MSNDQSLVPQNRIEDLATSLNSKQDNLSGSDSINISNNTLTAVGQIEKNASLTKYDWVGTRAQYNAQNIGTTHPEYISYITDDENTALIDRIDDLIDKVDSIIGIIYPIGSIYITTNVQNPRTILGVGTWEQVSSGRVLQGVDANHAVGTTAEAGLPNITGEFIPWSGKATYDLGPNISTSSTGAIRGISGTRTTILNESSNTGVGTIYAEFNASYSNSIYGNSTTVQPPAYFVYIWKRIS